MNAVYTDGRRTKALSPVVSRLWGRVIWRRFPPELSSHRYWSRSSDVEERREVTAEGKLWHRRFHAADHGLFRREIPLEAEKGRFAVSLTPTLNPDGLILALSLGGSSGKKKIRTPAAGSPLPGRLCWGFAGKPVSGAHPLLTYHKVFLKSQLYSVTSDPDAEKPCSRGRRVGLGASVLRRRTVGGGPCLGWRSPRTLRVSSLFESIPPATF